MTDIVKRLRAAAFGPLHTRSTVLVAEAADEIERLRAALAGCIDSLEYIDRNGIGVGGSTGWGVRAERIAKGKAALKEPTP